MTQKYKTIQKLSNRYRVRTTCRILGVSRAGYYGWLVRKPGKRVREDVAIRREILRSHTASPSYGVDNIHADVRERLICGRNRVRRLMREMGIRSCRKRKYKATTNSNHSYAIAPNLAREMKPTAPNQLWTADITYIATDEGWLYLAMVKDRFTREIVGYAMGPRITSELAQDALRHAIAQHKPPAGLVFHSDRGVQYCCHAFQNMLKEHHMIASMSRKGNPYDNAVSENFFSCLKCEMIYLQRFATRHDAALAVFRYIEGFYNRRRRHSALGRIAPTVFRKRWEREEAQRGLVGGRPGAPVP